MLAILKDQSIIHIRMKSRRRQWHPTPVLLPGKSHGQRSLVGCNPSVIKCRAGLSNKHWSHFSKIMLKILKARLQQYMDQELPDVQAVFRKGRGTRDQIVNIWLIIKKAREFQKSNHFCFIDYTKAFDCMDHNKPWKILKETPDHLTCLLRNLYAGQEAS